MGRHPPAGRSRRAGRDRGCRSCQCGEARAMSPAGTRAPISAERPHVLREYALLADGERGILVGPRGDFVWMCFPSWDSGAVFSSLIGGSGAYAVTPRERCVWGGYYEPDSLIWRSRWMTDDGAIIECREALALPTTPDRAVILRRVIAHQGAARLDVVLNPRGDFGHAPLRRLSQRDDGTWTAQLGGAHLSWVGGQDATPHADGHGGKALALTLELGEGAQHDLVLVLSRGAADSAPPEPERAWQGVTAAWRERVPDLARTVAPRDSRHADA